MAERPGERQGLPFAPERSSAAAHLPEGPSSRAWRLVDRVVLAGVLLGLLVPAIVLAIGVRARPIENRPLAKLPAVSVAGLRDGTWFRGVDVALADHLAVRPYAIQIRGELHLLTGGTGNPDVILGRDGWLFPRNAFEPACTHSVADVGATIDGAAAKLAALGITARFVVVPDKPAIYPERVAPNPFPTPCTELQRPELRATLAGLGARGVDGWTILEAARAANPAELLYFKGDTHWTPYGELQVLRALIPSIDPAAWDESEVVVSGSRARTDDLARQIGVNRVEETVGVALRPGVQPVETNLPLAIDLHNAPAIFTTTVTGDEPLIGGRTLILYDSYFAINPGLLSPFFADATWIHVGDMQRHPELATVLGPFNTVIAERVERFLYGDDFGTMVSGFGR